MPLLNLAQFENLFPQLASRAIHPEALWQAVQQLDIHSGAVTAHPRKDRRRT